MPVNLTKYRPHLLIAAELLLVIALALLATRPLWHFGPDVRVRGQEFSYLVGSGAVAAVTFEHTGRIPLWNSWMGRGEPLLENSFSYVNNPLMFLPVLAWGPYDGAKIAVIAHAVIAGLGGWMLAYLVGLKTAGRLLSAGLFAGHGGIVGAIGMGFYQMSLSQAYVPWIYAGTIGTLRRRDRWSVGLLVVGTALLLFAGTFWYALPTAIGVALLVGFGLFERDAAGRIRLNAVALRRIATAAVLIGAVAAVRLIPQAVNHEYVTHVEEYFPNPPRDFGWTAGLYFSPTMPPDSQISSLYFFYTLSPVFLILLLVGRTLIIPVGGKTPGTGRLIVPAAIAWLIFTTWAQEGGPFWVWVYETIPLLREWRFVTRMLAAGIPFLILIAAILFDDLVSAAQRWMRLSEPGTVGQLARALTALALYGIGGLAVVDTLYNWQRESGIEPVLRYTEPYMTYERARRPFDFISLQEWDFYNYFDHYELLIRTAYGNPDYQAGAVAPTLGTIDMMGYPAPEAIEYHGDFARWLAEHGYIAQPRPAGISTGTHWINPEIPPYAFRAPVGLFAPDRRDPLTAAEVEPVPYQYMMDTIRVMLERSAADQVVVVTETAYPGWTVTIDGQPAALESVGGLIGVRPGASDGPIEIVFAYRPGVLYVSSGITLVGAVALAVYLLRGERLLRRRVQG